MLLTSNGSSSSSAFEQNFFVSSISLSWSTHFQTGSSGRNMDSWATLNSTLHMVQRIGICGHSSICTDTCTLQEVVYGKTKKKKAFSWLREHKDTSKRICGKFEADWRRDSLTSFRKREKKRTKTTNVPIKVFSLKKIKAISDFLMKRFAWMIQKLYCLTKERQHLFGWYPGMLLCASSP